MQSLDIKVYKRSGPHRALAPRHAPWLIFPCKKNRKEYAFVSLSELKKTCLKRIPELSQKDILGSYYGWLFLHGAEDKSCSLFNPVSLESIDLPFLELALTQDKFCVFSRAPTNPNCVVFIIDQVSKTMVFCRLGDREWTVQEYGKKLADILERETDDVRFISVAGLDGKLYACTLGKVHLVVFEVDGENQLIMASLGVNFFPHHDPYTIRSLYYLMESFGELFYVRMGFREPFDCKEVRTINIFRFDFSQGEWVKVESLKDRALFLGRDCSASCYATDPGFKGDNIYFCMYEDKNLHSFNLEEGSVSVSEACPKLPTPWFEPFWLMPDPRITDIEKDRQEKQIEKNDEKGDNRIVEYDCSAKHLDEKLEVEENLWADLLLPDILSLVAKRLIPLDFMQFRAVCKRFQSTAPPSNWRTANLATQTSPPFLVFFKYGNGVYNFTDSMHSDTYFMTIPELLIDTSICDCRDGWLLMSRDLDGYMVSILSFNPFTKEIKEYPPFEAPLVLGISFKIMPGSSDFLVVAVYKPTLESILISYWHPGKDNWDEIEQESDFLPSNSPVFYEGAFYFLGLHGDLGVFRLTGLHIWEDLAQAPCDSFQSSYLVDCDGELLSVFVGHLGKWVRVFQLDLSKLVWVEIQNLGSHVLFVSNASSFSTVASSPEMRNRIYFPRFRNKSIVFYSLETRKFKSLGHEDSMDDLCGTSEPRDCSWIQPRWLTNAVVSG